jgi:hypothetical protein
MHICITHTLSIRNVRFKQERPCLEKELGRHGASLLGVEKSEVAIMLIQQLKFSRSMANIINFKISSYARFYSFWQL